MVSLAAPDMAEDPGFGLALSKGLPDLLTVK